MGRCRQGGPERKIATMMFGAPPSIDLQRYRRLREFFVCGGDLLLHGRLSLSCTRYEHTTKCSKF
jgi:hypothetical protein